MSDLKLVRTQRGFEVISFVDAYGKLCSLQQSSAIDGTEEGLANPGSSFVWLGVDVLATAAAEIDVTVGRSRMHLSRDQVSQLIEALQKWYDTGSFEQAAANDCEESDQAAELKAANEKVAKAKELLEKIVCTEGEDAGVIWLSDHSPTHAHTLANGRTIRVYDHEYFSPLGDALVGLWKVLNGEPAPENAGRQPTVFDELIGFATQTILDGLDEADGEALDAAQRAQHPDAYDESMKAFLSKTLLEVARQSFQLGRNDHRRDGLQDG